MTRRSTPQAKIDDSAFPIRMLICVPEMGFGRRSDALHEWLTTRIGRGNYAWHGGGRGGMRDRIALYFREPDAASACLTAFPDLELADGTCLPGYSSPYLNSVAEQAQSACPMGQPISHPTKSGFSRCRARPLRIRREAVRPCEAIMEAQSGREIGACGEDGSP